MPDTPDPPAPLPDPVTATGQGRRELGDLPLPEELTALLPPGSFIVESFLGQGGMGAVYRGTQVRLQRPVAIKIMRRDEGDPSYEERFRREALAMAQLNHPNIVNVIDYGEAGPDHFYLVMEFVDGADLLSVIRSGGMTQRRALEILPQICDALQFAHDHGIVHRDIKPANVMLTRDGRVKMADFGLAKRFDADSSFRTASGTGMGTPDYAAPEQFQDAALVDHRADIYALGVMIYHMLTGHLPRGAWKPPSWQPGIEPAWDDIVARAMEPNPIDRYARASEVKTDVSRIQPSAHVTTPPSGSAAPVSSTDATIITAPGARRPSVVVPAAPAGKPSKVLPVSVVVGVAVLLALAVWSWPGRNGDAAASTGGIPAVQPSGTPSPPPITNPNTAPFTKTAPFINSLGMKFLPVPGTDVLMAVHETRVKDYAAFAVITADVDTSWKRPVYQNVPVDAGPEHPVVMVSWEEAQRFCNWLSQREGRRYRLPMDREWSRAVGLPQEEANLTPQELSGRIRDHYPWGTTWPPPRAAGNYSDLVFREKFPNAPFIPGYWDGFATTAPVGSFPPNDLGFHDLGGNVWEWMQEPYSPQSPNRIVRGGSWRAEQIEQMLSSRRGGGEGPRNRHPNNGFRIVLAVDEPPPNPSSATVIMRWPAGPVPWTDAQNKLLLRAEFEELKDGSVRLKKEDGTLETVSLDRLSTFSRKTAHDLAALPHRVKNIRLDPPSPAILLHGEKIQITYDYQSAATPLQIFCGMASIRQSSFPGMMTAQAPTLHASVGSGSSWVSVQSGNRPVDLLTFALRQTPGASRTEYSMPVNYVFTETPLRDHVLDETDLFEGIDMRGAPSQWSHGQSGLAFNGGGSSNKCYARLAELLTPHQPGEFEAELEVTAHDESACFGVVFPYGTNQFHGAVFTPDTWPVRPVTLTTTQNAPATRAPTGQRARYFIRFRRGAQDVVCRALLEGGSGKVGAVTSAEIKPGNANPERLRLAAWGGRADFHRFVLRRYHGEVRQAPTQWVIAPDP